MSQTEKNKAIGIISIIFGLTIISPILIQGVDKFVTRSDIFLIKYFVLILFINSGLLFVLFGIFFIFGFLVPSVSANYLPHEMAKNSLYFIFVSLPVWISGTVSVFFESRNIVWNVLWLCVIVYLIYIFVLNLKIIRMSRKDQ